MEFFLFFQFSCVDEHIGLGSVVACAKSTRGCLAKKGSGDMVACWSWLAILLYVKFLNRKSTNPWLRDKLIVPYKSVYYAAIVSNLFNYKFYIFSWYKNKLSSSNTLFPWLTDKLMVLFIYDRLWMCYWDFRGFKWVWTWKFHSCTSRVWLQS